MQVIFRASKLQKIRKKYKKTKRSPFLKTPHTQNALVLDISYIEAKQPNSAKRKIAKVQLVKSKKIIKTYIPYSNTNSLLKPHDNITIRSIGGSLKRAKGDLYGLNTEIIKVNGVCIKQLYYKKV